MDKVDVTKVSCIFDKPFQEKGWNSDSVMKGAALKRMRLVPNLASYVQVADVISATIQRYSLVIT